MTKIIRKRNKLGQFTKFSSWTNNFSKFAPVVLVLIMGMVFLNVPATNAYFSDTESSTGNTFTAGTLDFSLNPSTDFVSSALLKGDTASYSTTLVNDGTLGFQYTASTTDVGGDSDLCNYMTLQANLNGVSVYTGLLSSFSVVAGNYINPSAWDFVVTLPSGAADSLQDKTCNFKITFSGWQENLPNNSQGFSNIAQINATVSSGHWYDPPAESGVVLNEFLPNPDGPNFGDDADAKPKGEWVELYNNSNTVINLTGWSLTDKEGDRINVEGCRTNTGGTIIAGNGYLVVYRKGNDTCNSHYFDLENSGDTITLWNNNVSVDSYTYTLPADFCHLDPTPGSTNDDTGNGIGNGCTDEVPENKSYARVPDGIGAWVDPIPTPGESNILEEVLAPSPLPGEGGGEVLGPDSEGLTAQIPVFEPLVEPVVETTPEAASVESSSEPMLEAVVEIEPAIEPEQAPEAITTPPLAPLLNQGGEDVTTVSSPPLEGGVPEGGGGSSDPIL